MIELSKRLQAVADLVSVGRMVCDAGCDHGYVSIYLIQKGICQRVLAMDVNAGPLARAKEHIEAYGLEKYIEVRLSDGVSALKEKEADALILAGMGGRLIRKILTDGKEKINEMKELILQPQSEIQSVREFLHENGYHIAAEDIVYEDGKYYPMIKALPVKEKDQGGRQERDLPETDDLKEQKMEERQRMIQTAYDRYGELLLKERHPVLHEFLLWEKKRAGKVRLGLCQGRAEETLRGKERLAELRMEEAVRDCALSFFGEENNAL